MAVLCSECPTCYRCELVVCRPDADSQGDLERHMTWNVLCWRIGSAWSKPNMLEWSRDFSLKLVSESPSLWNLSKEPGPESEVDIAFRKWYAQQSLSLFVKPISRSSKVVPSDSSIGTRVHSFLLSKVTTRLSFILLIMSCYTRFCSVPFNPIKTLNSFIWLGDWELDVFRVHFHL